MRRNFALSIFPTPKSTSQAPNIFQKTHQLLYRELSLLAASLLTEFRIIFSFNLTELYGLNFESQHHIAFHYRFFLLSVLQLVHTMSELVQRTTSSLSSWPVQKTGIRVFYLDYKLSGQKKLVFWPICLCYSRDIRGLSSSTELLLELKQLSNASVTPLKLKIHTRWHVFKLVSSHLEQRSLIFAFSFKNNAVPTIANGEARCAQSRAGICLRRAAETAIASGSCWEGRTEFWPSPSAQAPRENSPPTALWCSQLPQCAPTYMGFRSLGSKVQLRDTNNYKQPLST